MIGPALLRICFYICGLFVAVQLHVSAATFGNFTYQVVGSEIMITRFPTGFSGTVEIPATIEGLPVTQIGTQAFSGCEKVTALTMPDTVVSLGSRAFYNCRTLASITLSQGLVTISGTAFENCYALTSVSLPASLQSIGTQAFLYCTGLASIHIPAGVLTFGQIPFSGCTALAGVTVDAANPNYTAVDGVLYNKAVTMLVQCPAGKTGDLVVPEGVTSIPQYGVSRAAHLTRVTLPSTIATLGTGAFQHCSSLLSINIPQGVTEIPPAAFFNCISLESIGIPASVTSLSDFALEECLSLSDIDLAPSNSSYVKSQGALFDAPMSKIIRCETDHEGHFVIPASVTVILSKAFAGCGNLQGLTIPSTGISIGNSAFHDCHIKTIILASRHISRWRATFTGTSAVDEIIVTPSSGMSSLAENAFKNLTSVKKVVIQPGVTERLPVAVFSGCTFLNEISLPADLTAIDEQAFKECLSLEEISIPPAVEFIGTEIFAGCISLRSVELPEGITHVPWLGFSGCVSLESVRFPDSVTHIMDEAFRGCSALVSLDLNKVSFIGNAAFDGCTGLVDLILPPSAGTIISSFSNCTGIRSVTASTSQLPMLSSGLGAGVNPEQLIILPTEEETRVAGIGYSGYRRVTISEGVEGIFERALEGMSDLVVLNLPSTLTRIESGSFGYSGIRSLVFQGDAPETDELAFENVDEGFTVYYFDDAEGFSSPLWRGVPAVNLGARTPQKVWKARNHLPHDVAMDSDPVQTGVQLLMAYALGLDPHRSGVADLPEVEVSGTDLSLRFPVGAAGITYEVETSGDLVEWETNGVVLSPPDGEGFRHATYAGESGNRFMRLVVRE